MEQSQEQTQQQVLILKYKKQSVANMPSKLSPTQCPTYSQTLNKAQIPTSYNTEGLGVAPTTERKPNTYLEYGSISDQIETPAKYQLTSHRLKQEAIEVEASTAKYRRLLSKLDQAEQKLVISEKKYGELWRKYEALKEKNQSIDRELSRSEEKRLQELLDLQNKFRLLEDQDHANRKLLQSKEQSLLLLRTQLNQKNQKVIDMQSKFGALQIELTQKALQKDRELTFRKESEEKLKELQIEEIVSAHKKQTQTLKAQISRLENYKTEFEVENKKLVQDIQALYSKSKQSEKQHLQEIKNLQRQYTQWLEDAKEEKNSLVDAYQKRVGDLLEQIKRNEQIVEKEIKGKTAQQYQNTVSKEEENLQLMKENRSLQEDAKLLQKSRTELKHKLQRLENENAELRQQKVTFEEVKLADKSKMSRIDRDRAEETQKYSEVLSELTRIKADFEQVFKLNDKLNKQALLKQSTIANLQEEVEQIRNELRVHESAELNLNREVSHSNKKLQARIFEMQEENENLTKQLLTERLQNAKLQQELEEQNTEMKREYELSLENIERSLSKKIKHVKEEKLVSEKEKEEIYLEMRELERKYELLMSEMLTVDDMMSIATKVHKRHSTFKPHPK